MRGNEKTIKGIEHEIATLKEDQTNHASDIAYFHYTQHLIDKLEDELDELTNRRLCYGNI